MPLTVVDGAMLNTANAQYTMFKNKLINGAFNVWQRATSFAAPANLAYTADRWFSVWGTANRTVSRQTGFSGSQYCLRVARNSGTTDNSYSGIVQIIEANNLYDLQGQTVTLSFSARRGANFSATSNALLIYLQSGTVADQGSATYWSPGWTGSTAPINTSVTLTTTEQTFSIQATVPSNSLELNVAFQYLATGTAGANDYFEITNVQLEKGSNATTFDDRPYGTELALCQRYYWQQGPYVTGAGDGLNYVFCPGAVWSNTWHAYTQFPATMRVAPTIASSAASTFQFHVAGVANGVLTGISTSYATVNGARISGGTTYGGTAGLSCQIACANSSTTFLGFNAEL